MKTIWISVVSALILCGGATAQQKVEDLKARDLQAAFRGDSEGLERLMKVIEEALSTNPNNPKAMVTHGIGLLRRSGDLAQKGQLENSARVYQSAIDEMERAVRLAPDSDIVRIPRGSTFISASRMMPPQMAKQLLETWVSDFEKVLQLQEADKTFSKRSAHQRGELLTGLADGWNRMGNKEKASGYFERIVAELKGTVYETRAQAWLENKPESKSPAFFACSGCHAD